MLITIIILIWIGNEKKFIQKLPSTLVTEVGR